eukprot:3474523-Rhodomonas_salina.1
MQVAPPPQVYVSSIATMPGLNSEAVILACTDKGLAEIRAASLDYVFLTSGNCTIASSLYDT